MAQNKQTVQQRGQCSEVQLSSDPDCQHCLEDHLLTLELHKHSRLACTSVVAWRGVHTLHDAAPVPTCLSSLATAQAAVKVNSPSLRVKVSPLEIAVVNPENITEVTLQKISRNV